MMSDVGGACPFIPELQTISDNFINTIDGNDKRDYS